VGSRAAAQNTCERVGLAQLLLLFPSLPVVRATITCERRNLHKQQLILSFSFCADPFSDLLFCSCCSFLLFQNGSSGG